ncbi:MAG: alpha-N-arabinofuranosidase [Eubacteriales bacterium]
MKKAILATDKYFRLAEVNPRIYGSFAEHMGRCIYGGIYEPGNPLSDKDGYRQDVAKTIKDMGVSLVRYPGGNFVSNFRWEDSVGDPATRPVRLEAAWQNLEDNSFGLNEFMKWARMVGTEPMMAVNLGSRGIEEAASLLEYCNFPKGTYLSDLRRSHGVEDPHNIKLWCLGNEMDGPWQIGYKTAAEYGMMAARAGMLMKRIDPSIELAACGSAGKSLPSFGEWDATVAELSYDFIDYLSAHIYFDNKPDKTPEATKDFLAGAMELEDTIRSVTAACDYARAKRKKKKTINISLDEWNATYRPHGKVPPSMWIKAPHQIEDIFAFEDALLIGSILITMQNHADRVKAACLAQIVNVIAPILTSETQCVRQTIFYPFADASRYGRGTTLSSVIECPTYESRKHGTVPILSGSVIHNEEKGELALFIVNRDGEDVTELKSDLRQFAGKKIIHQTVYSSADLRAANDLEHPCAIVPEKGDYAAFDRGVLTAHIAPYSWNVIVLGD